MSTLDSTVIRDENRKTIWWGVSSVDGTTLCPISIDSSNGGLMVEDGVTTMPVMSAIPETLPRDGNRTPALAGVSSGNANVMIPVSVNPTTGAVMIQST